MSENGVKKEIMEGIHGILDVKDKESYNYQNFPDKKVLHVSYTMQPAGNDYLYFVVNDAADGTQYFTTRCNVNDNAGIEAAVEYVCSRFSAPERPIDYDGLACVIIDEFERDRTDSGRKEIVKGMRHVLKQYTSEHDKEVIDEMLMIFTGWSLDTLIEKTEGYEYED